MRFQHSIYATITLVQVSPFEVGVPSYIDNDFDSVILVQNKLLLLLVPFLGGVVA